MRPKLVIFDCDGVLIDSELIACRVTGEALTRAGYPVSLADVIERFVGLSAKSQRQVIEQELGRPLPAEFEAETHEELWAAFADELAAIAGMEEVVANLSVASCVASGSSVERLHYTLGLAGLRDRFAGKIFSADAVEHGKPAPDLFLLAARQMGAAPADCLVIEDSLPGVQAALAAGMAVLGFCGGGHCTRVHASRLLQQGALAVFSDASSLPRLLS